MRLVEQRRLRLDDPIRRWWPAWRGDPEATVRDLLGRTSRMKDPPEAFFIRVFDHSRVTPTRRQFVAGAGKPGPRTEEAEYSDAGFVLAGLIVERAGGAPIVALARPDVLSAPGGDGLAFQPGERPARPHAHSYWYPDGLGHPVDINNPSGLLPRRSLITIRSGAIGVGRRRPVARSLGQRAARRPRPGAVLAAGDGGRPSGRVLGGLSPRTRQVVRRRPRAVGAWRQWLRYAQRALVHAEGARHGRGRLERRRDRRRRPDRPGARERGGRR